MEPDLKTLMVVNPNSANGATRRRFRKLQSVVLDTFKKVKIDFTRAPGHATDLVREALIQGFERIVAVGGDGTNNEVVNGFYDGMNPINPNAQLGLLSSGTGGDLRRFLGTGKLSQDGLIALSTSDAKPIDLGMASFIDHQGERIRRLFINVTSFGLSGRVVRKVNCSTKLLGGRLSFVLGSLKALIGYHSQQVHLRVLTNDHALKLDESMSITNVVLANGQYFGGGMWVAPTAKLDDGLFDLIIIGSMKKPKLMLKIPTIYKGKHIFLPEVRCFKGTHIEAESKEQVLIDMDGEQVGRLPMMLDILPRSLQLIIPSS